MAKRFFERVAKTYQKEQWYTVLAHIQRCLRACARKLSLLNEFVCSSIVHYATAAFSRCISRTRSTTRYFTCYFANVPPCLSVALLTCSRPSFPRASPLRPRPPRSLTLYLLSSGSRLPPLSPTPLEPLRKRFAPPPRLLACHTSTTPSLRALPVPVPVVVNRHRLMGQPSRLLRVR